MLHARFVDASHFGVELEWNEASYSYSHQRSVMYACPQPLLSHTSLASSG